MDNFITILLQNREENNTFNLQDEELEIWENKLEQAKNELGEIVLKHLDEKYQSRASHTMFEIEEIIRNIFEIKKVSYYKAGVIDGANIHQTLKE